MRLETLRESKWTRLKLTHKEQADLQAAGKQLAKGTGRFGQPLEAASSSVVHVQRVDETYAEVRIDDAIGMVATPTLQLQVVPKIPPHHLLHLLCRANILPRLAEHAGALGESTNFAVLVSNWFVAALDRLLEEGLARDYRPVTDEISAVRGRIVPLATARFFYLGRTTVLAEFEEFDFNTPLNRVLLHAARIVASSTALPAELRRRAIRTTKQLEGVGPFRPADLLAEPERRTANYRDPILLARHVIRSTGRSLEAGPAKSWTFLFRTPEAIESGIRDVLKTGLAVHVEKRQIALGGSNMTVNPDLVFANGLAVADVKYKLAREEWNRPDLYQVVAFAAALKTTECAIVTFRHPSSENLPAVQVGDYCVREFTWPTAEAIQAESAAATLVDQIQDWLDELSAHGHLASAA